MKSIIKHILFVVLLISIIHDSQCRWFILKNRLSHFINRISELKEQDSREAKLYKSFDIDCGKNFLKVQQNSKMLVNEEEELVFKVASSLKCSSEDAAFKFYFDEIIRPKLKKGLSCFELHLQQQEPDSKLIKNAIITKAEVEKCKKQSPIDDLKEVENGLEDVIGPLDVFSCGAVTSVDDYVLFVTKSVLIKFGESSEAVKKVEMEKLKEYLKDIAFTTAECIFKRFETDPKGTWFIFVGYVARF
uniref:Balbiani ring A 28 kDa protein n=1 Tax=Chironomus thummi thummi TaxID=7155 RepID=BRA2_CHITH|nr:RecName: Full=Balbiani ring A 28 kDa protein; Flags: Precursor [Chironomus thummi thummi]AAA72921.1 unnamed protein product [Chironomus thummi]prf//1211233A ORF,Balbiani ring Bha [Chironomus thummi]